MTNRTSSPAAGRTLVDIVETQAEAERCEVPPLLVRERLAAVAPGDGPLEVELLGDGHSNVTFVVRRGAARWVLRRPPRPPYAPKAHDVVREYRMLEGLAGTGVPVPTPLLLCEDPTPLGAPFYLMEYVEGHVIRDALPAALDRPGAEELIADELAAGLAAIHAVDWRAARLPVRGAGARYLERQLALWRTQWAHGAIRRVPAVEEAGARLARALPPSPPPTLVHGDYKLDNVLFGAAAPPRLRAVLDWEMATVGDPLADLGFMSATWLGGGADRDRLLGLSAATAGAGFPPREQLVARYAERSGRDVGHLAWYEAFALWKLAVLLEASYRRFVGGTDDDPFFARLQDGVPQLAELALEHLDR